LELKSDYYWELTNKYTSYRKKVLHALSQSASELFSKKTAQDFDLGAVSSTQKAIDVFISDGIIERNQSTYDFSDPGLHLRQKQTLKTNFLTPKTRR